MNFWLLSYTQRRYTNAATLHTRITVRAFKCSNTDSLKTNSLGPCIRTLRVGAGHDQPHTGPPWISSGHGTGVPFKSSALGLETLLKWYHKVYPPLALVLAFVLVSKGNVPCWVTFALHLTIWSKQPLMLSDTLLVINSYQIQYCCFSSVCNLSALGFQSHIAIKAKDLIFR